MVIVYYDNEKGEHITLEIDKIETTISADDLLVTYYEGPLHDKKEKVIEKASITSINVQY